MGDLETMAKEFNDELDEAYAAGEAGETVNNVDELDESGDADASVEEGQVSESGNAQETQQTENSEADDASADASGEEGRQEEETASNDGDRNGNSNSFVPIERFAQVNRERRKLYRDLTGAEKSKKALEQRIAELEESQNIMAQRMGGEVPNINDALSDEKLKSLREDYGDEIADVIMALRYKTETGGVQQDISAGGGAVDQQDQMADQMAGMAGGEPVYETWEDVVASVPTNHVIHKLDYWKEFEPELFAKAQAVERQMVEAGETTGLDIADFYSEVVNRVETTNQNSGVENTGQVANGYQQAPAQPAPEFKRAVPAARKTTPDSLGDAVGATVAPTGSVALELGQLNPKELLAKFNEASPEEKARLDEALWG